MNKDDSIIGSADLHIHSRCPENRKGNYLRHVVFKFSKILEITAVHSGPKILIVAGDFFDAPNVPYHVTRIIMELIMTSGVTVLVVPGQHDLRYHVGGLDNTPLGMLQTAGCVKILTPYKSTYNGISFVGAGWNEEPEEKADILVMHRMITKKGELWPGQTNYSSAHAIMRKYPWAKCIISGDNHAPHTLRIPETPKGHSYRLQINCGSMVRSTKSQIGFQPRVHKIDTKNWKSKIIKIQCLPDEDVFDFNKININEMKKEMKMEAEAKISEFIKMLPEDEQEKPNFKKILNNVVIQDKPKNSVKDIINNTMENLNGK